MRGPAPVAKPRSGDEGAIRLQSLMARAGLASRREAETMIVEGRVSVNGRVVTELGSRAVPGRDHVKVDGKLILAEERKVYFVLNKPRGVITAARDPHDRPVVLDYLKVRERIFPVGRLDWDSEGLVLLTNDGDLAYKLTHPKFEMARTYHVKVKGIPDEDALVKLRRGVHLEDGKAAVTKIRQIETTENNAWLEIVVQEGRNRLVRRIMERVGYPVQKLKRVSYAGVQLGNLKPGESRALSAEELQRLQHKTEKATPPSVSSGRFAPPPSDFRPDAGAEASEAGDEEE